MIDYDNFISLLKKLSLEPYVQKLIEKKYNSKKAFQNFEEWGSLPFFISLLYAISDKGFPKTQINGYLNPDNTITEKSEEKFLKCLREDFQKETLFIKKLINFEVLEKILGEIFCGKNKRYKYDCKLREDSK